MLFRSVLVNFIIVKITNNRMSHYVLSRQLLNNQQYHLQKELSKAIGIKKTNLDFLKKIDIFLLQPLQIKSININQNNVALEAFILKADIQVFCNYLSEIGILAKTRFEDMGDRVWVSIKSS